MSIIIDQPYSQVLYDQIDRKANKLIKQKLEDLRRYGLDIKMGTEIEFNVSTTDGARSLGQKLLNIVESRTTASKNGFDNFAHLVKQVTEEYCADGMLELACGEFSPEIFASFVKSARQCILGLAKEIGTDVSFVHRFPSQLPTRFPSQQINISLWDGARNLFKSYKQGVDEMRGLMTFVINRLIEDIKDSVILFAAGDFSLMAIQHRGRLNARLEFADYKHYCMLAKYMLLLRDRKDSQSAHLELRKIADAPGVDSAKALLLTASVADSIDYLIRRYSDRIEQEGRTKSISVILEKAIKNEKNDQEIMDKAQHGIIDHSEEEQYRLGSVFASQKDSQGKKVAGRRAALARFRDSERMKQLLGHDLHTLLCKIKLPRRERQYLQAHVNPPYPPGHNSLCSNSLA